MKKKKAFTLAEVLISLAIIGVIAAITVPTLIQRTNKQEYVSALQKAYSTLSQVTNQIIAEEGSPKCDDGGWACSTEEIYNLFKKHLNNAKECGSGTGCFEQGKYKHLHGSGTENWETHTGGRKLILNDGVQVDFKSVYLSCNGAISGSTDVCTWIGIDVNGVKKPNIAGRDAFAFVLKQKGLYPAGCGNPNLCVRSDSFGWDCACKVLREGAMNY